MLLSALLIVMTAGGNAQSVELTTLAANGHPLSVIAPSEPAADGVPIVVSLHYGGPAPRHYGRGLLEQVVAPALADLGAVMVAPDCPGPAWSDRGCARDVEHAIEHAVQHHGGDHRRVILVGYSKGGIGAWALSDAAPERFAAVVVMAGAAMPADAATHDSPPAFVLHGEADELFSIDAVKSAVEARSARGQQVELDILEGVTHYDTAAYIARLSRLKDPLRRVTTP